MGRAKKASRNVLLEGTSLVIGNWSASHKFMGLDKFQGRFTMETASDSKLIWTLEQDKNMYKFEVNSS